MGPFWQFARRMLRYRGTLVLAMVFAMFSAVSFGAGLIGLAPVFQNILGQGTGATTDLADLAVRARDRLPEWVGSQLLSDSMVAALPDGPFNAVLWLIIGLGVLTLWGAMCNALHAYLSLTAISRTVASVRRDAFRRALHMPLDTALSVGPSDTVSRIVYDSATLSSGFNALVSKAVANITKGLAAVVAAFWLDWETALISLLAAPLLAIIIRKLGKRIRRASRGALEGQALLYRRATEALGGIRVVKVSGAERFELGRFHEINKQVVLREFAMRRARALSSPLLECVAIFVLGSLFLIAAKAIIDGRADPNALLVALGSLALAAAQIKPVSGFISDIQQASAAAERIQALMNREPEPGHGIGLPRLARHTDSVRLESVFYTYPGATEPALRGVDLEIRCGEVVAIVGPNGSGKTTLLAMVPRLLDPSSGRVLVDGVDIRAVSVRSLRRQIGMVTQETVLFAGTMRDNIAYGWSASDAEIERVVGQSSLSDVVRARSGGINAALGEAGAGLSGGQKQRLAIARALLRRPSILLLDEATSMLDSDAEADVNNAIDAFIGGAEDAGERRTCIIIAHRPATIQRAHRVVVMDRGTIVDAGTHGDLLQRCAVYKQLMLPRST